MQTPALTRSFQAVRAPPVFPAARQHAVRCTRRAFRAAAAPRQQQHQRQLEHQQHTSHAELQVPNREPAAAPATVPAVGSSRRPVGLRRQRARLVAFLSRRTSALVPAAAKEWLARHDNPRLRGLAMLNAMALLLGSNWVVVKASGADCDPWVFTALRFLLAAAAFAPFLPKGLTDKQLRSAGLEIGFWSAAGYLTQAAALAHTPASRASLLSTFTVLAVPLLAGLSGARIKPMVWGCGAAALVGTSLLEAGGGAPPNIGDAFSILSALFFAVQLFRTEQVSRQLQQEGTASTLPLMAVSMVTVALLSGAGAAGAHWEEAAGSWASLQGALTALTSGDGSAVAAAAAAAAGHNPLHTLGELLYTSLCTTDLALWLEMVALQYVTSTEAAMVYSMEPVSGALMAYAFLGDRWGAAGWAGAALIVVASLCTQSQGAVEEEPSADEA